MNFEKIGSIKLKIKNGRKCDEKSIYIWLWTIIL